MKKFDAFYCASWFMAPSIPWIKTNGGAPIRPWTNRMPEYQDAQSIMFNKVELSSSLAPMHIQDGIDQKVMQVKAELFKGLYRRCSGVAIPLHCNDGLARPPGCVLAAGAMVPSCPRPRLDSRPAQLRYIEIFLCIDYHNIVPAARTRRRTASSARAGAEKVRKEKFDWRWYHTSTIVGTRYCST